jgi:hypothetical protein
LFPNRYPVSRSSPPLLPGIEVERLGFYFIGRTTQPNVTALEARNVKSVASARIGEWKKTTLFPGSHAAEAPA